MEGGRRRRRAYDKLADLARVIPNALLIISLQDAEEDEVECKEREDGRHFPAAAEAVRAGKQGLHMYI